MYPTQMREIEKSMAILRKHATEWNINEKQIAICGFSAGAHNCAMYAVYWNHPVITEFLHEASEQPAAECHDFGLSTHGLYLYERKCGGRIRLRKVCLECPI